jgi:hypothetical protein
MRNRVTEMRNTVTELRARSSSNPISNSGSPMFKSPTLATLTQILLSFLHCVRLYRDYSSHRRVPLPSTSFLFLSLKRTQFYSTMSTMMNASFTIHNKSNYGITLHFRKENGILHRRIMGHLKDSVN